MVRISLASKSRAQEARYHAMIGDIAKQYQFCERLWDADDMKRLLIDQFRRDTKHDLDLTVEWAGMGFTEMAPAFDGSGVVMLGIQSRKFPKKLATSFIEWLYAFGAKLEKPIVWSEPERWSA